MAGAGLEFEELSEIEQAEALQQMSLLCRVEPSHKQRLVEVLKAQVERHLAAIKANVGLEQ